MVHSDSTVLDANDELFSWLVTYYFYMAVTAGKNHVSMNIV